MGQGFERMIGAHYAVTSENLSIKRQQVVTRLRSYPEMLLAQPLVAGVLVSMLWSEADHVKAGIWVALFICYWLSDFAGYWLLRKKISTAQEIHRWLRLASLMGAFSGLVWGIGAWLLYVPEELGDQTILLTVLNGIAAGAIAVVPTFSPSLILFMLGIGVPMVSRMATVPDTDHHLIALMLVAYLAFMTRAGLNLCETFKLALSRGWERDQLNEALDQKRQMAEEANMAKSRFLAAASHDLRQPLQALNLFLEVLDASIEAPAQVKLVGQINRSVSSLNEMFTQLLDLSKLDAGTIKPEFSGVRLRSLLERIHNDFHILAEKKRIKSDSEYGGRFICP